MHKQKAARVIQNAFRNWRNLKNTKLEMFAKKINQNTSWELKDCYLGLWTGLFIFRQYTVVNENFDQDWVYRSIRYIRSTNTLNFLIDHTFPQFYPPLEVMRWTAYSNLEGKYYFVDQVASFLDTI